MTQQSALRCIVVDDEPLACQLIASYVERTPGLELKGAYTAIEDANEAIAAGDIDLAFLDIQMPRMSGIELARILPPHTRVVFVTAYTDYAVEGFRVNALHYLLKPVSYNEFLEAVKRANNEKAPAAEAVQVSASPEFLTVKSEYRILRLRIADIEYIESLKDYVKIYIDGEPHPILTLMSLKSVEQMLPQQFMRVHRSFVVNMDKVRVLERSHILFGKRIVPVSDTFRPAFLQRFGISDDNV